VYWHLVAEGPSGIRAAVLGMRFDMDRLSEVSLLIREWRSMVSEVNAESGGGSGRETTARMPVIEGVSAAMRYYATRPPLWRMKTTVRELWARSWATYKTLAKDPELDLRTIRYQFLSVSLCGSWF
jgi:hypothetical protein